ncbi:hypothetical protein U8335_14240 [Roseiconus lacunae]|uniref:hypothetical protein n=1 Tax=Roseiconus lacunae TaxID=2605694 RepID=UPI00308BCE41|nr:hypothetical protein U8335_14240 [Stieleria sp. HD01]
MDCQPAPPKARWTTVALFAALCAAYAAENRPCAAVEARLDDAAESHSTDDAPFQVTIEISEIVDGKPHPIDRHLVIFKDNRAYDFSLVPPMDVTVVDWNEKQMTVLSRQKSLQSSIPIASVLQTAAQIRVFAKKNDAEERLGISAQATRTADGAVELAFADYQYKATTHQATTPQQAARFAQFTGAVKRLNLARHRGAPPFARISLGNEIASKGEFPKNVQLTIGNGSTTRTLVSHYTAKDALSPESENRVNKVQGMMTLYSDVPLSDLP